jgi:hypothetical protein
LEDDALTSRSHLPLRWSERRDDEKEHDALQVPCRSDLAWRSWPHLAGSWSASPDEDPS